VDTVSKKKIPSPRRESNPDRSKTIVMYEYDRSKSRGSSASKVTGYG